MTFNKCQRFLNETQIKDTIMVTLGILVLILILWYNLYIYMHYRYMSESRLFWTKREKIKHSEKGSGVVESVN